MKVTQNYKLHNNFEFCEEKFHKHWNNILIYKAKQFMMTKQFKESLHILEDGASGRQVDDIKQAIV